MNSSNYNSPLPAGINLDYDFSQPPQFVGSSSPTMPSVNYDQPFCARADSVPDVARSLSPVPFGGVASALEPLDSNASYNFNIAPMPNTTSAIVEDEFGYFDEYGRYTFRPQPFTVAPMTTVSAPARPAAQRNLARSDVEVLGAFDMKPLDNVLPPTRPLTRSNATVGLNVQIPPVSLNKPKPVLSAVKPQPMLVDYSSSSDDDVKVVESKDEEMTAATDDMRAVEHEWNTRHLPCLVRLRAQIQKAAVAEEQVQPEELQGILMGVRRLAPGSIRGGGARQGWEWGILWNDPLVTDDLLRKNQVTINGKTGCRPRIVYPRSHRPLCIFSGLAFTNTATYLRDSEGTYRSDAFYNRSFYASGVEVQQRVGDNMSWIPLEYVFNGNGVPTTGRASKFFQDVRKQAPMRNQSIYRQLLDLGYDLQNWQVEVLGRRNLLGRSNVVISRPTIGALALPAGRARASAGSGHATVGTLFPAPKRRYQLVEISDSSDDEDCSPIVPKRPRVCRK